MYENACQNLELVHEIRTPTRNNSCLDHIMSRAITPSECKIIDTFISDHKLILTRVGKSRRKMSLLQLTRKQRTGRIRKLVPIELMTQTVLKLVSYFESLPSRRFELSSTKINNSVQQINLNIHLRLPRLRHPQLV